MFLPDPGALNFRMRTVPEKELMDVLWFDASFHVFHMGSETLDLRFANWYEHWPYASFASAGLSRDRFATILIDWLFLFNMPVSVVSGFEGEFPSFPSLKLPWNLDYLHLTHTVWPKDSSAAQGKGGSDERLNHISYNRSWFIWYTIYHVFCIIMTCHISYYVSYRIMSYVIYHTSLSYIIYHVMSYHIIYHI